MKFLLLLPLFFFSCFGSYAQNKNIPIDSITGRITYAGVIQVEGVEAAELYSRAREWLARAYGSSKEVIEMDDRELGKIVGKALMTVYAKALGSEMEAGYIHYTISIHARDGRYRYEVTNFYHRGMPLKHLKDYGACEGMLYADINSKKREERGLAYFIEQLDANTKELIEQLESAMKVATRNNDDW